VQGGFHSLLRTIEGLASYNRAVMTTTTTPNPFAVWLLQQLAGKGWSNAELARRANVGRAAVSTWLTEWVFPRPEQQRALAAALDVDVGAVASKVFEARAVKEGRAQPAPQAEQPSGGLSDIGRALGTVQRVLDDLDLVPMGDIAAGPGVWLDEPYAFPRAITRRKRAAAFVVRGDSMEPEVPEGSVVGVFVEQEAKPGDIVIAWTPEGGVVKRLAQTPKGYELQGTNDYRLPLSDEVHIVGVVFSVMLLIGHSGDLYPTPTRVGHGPVSRNTAQGNNKRVTIAPSKVTDSEGANEKEGDTPAHRSPTAARLRQRHGGAGLRGG